MISLYKRLVQIACWGCVLAPVHAQVADDMFPFYAVIISKAVRPQAWKQEQLWVSCQLSPKQIHHTVFPESIILPLCTKNKEEGYSIEEDYCLSTHTLFLKPLVDFAGTPERWGNEAMTRWRLDNREALEQLPPSKFFRTLIPDSHVKSGVKIIPMSTLAGAGKAFYCKGTYILKGDTEPRDFYYENSASLFMSLDQVTNELARTVLTVQNQAKQLAEGWITQLLQKAPVKLELTVQQEADPNHSLEGYTLEQVLHNAQAVEGGVPIICWDDKNEIFHAKISTAWSPKKEEQESPLLDNEHPDKKEIHKGWFALPIAAWITAAWYKRKKKVQPPVQQPLELQMTSEEGVKE